MSIATDYYKFIVFKSPNWDFRTLDFDKDLALADSLDHGDGPSDFDRLGSIEQWVEQHTPPDRQVAAHVANGGVDRTRPLCPYPQVAVCSGAGSTDDAKNYVCRR